MNLQLNEIICGDCLEVMKSFPDNSIDSIVTDPPYGLKFMGKKWDYDVPSVEQWKEALRVLKPGGHVLSFGGTRTYHRMVVNIEDAGFEIRDQILWLYGSGFPKSLDVSKAIDKLFGKEAEREVICNHPNPAGNKGGGNSLNMSVVGMPTEAYLTAPATPEAQMWEGWGTALKPAVECICLARKPLNGTVADNVLQWGTGGLNIDGCRIDLNGENPPTGSAKRVYKSNQYTDQKIYGDNKTTSQLGRFPANVILDEEAGRLLDLQSGERPSGKGNGNAQVGEESNGAIKPLRRGNLISRNDSGGASRFFYCAKASKKERGEYNNHPTVKPIKLIRYLIRLITPPGGIVLDMFGGSGTTALAAIKERVKYIVIEENRHNVEDISERRIAEATRQERIY